MRPDEKDGNRRREGKTGRGGVAQRLVVATSNAGKMREFERMLENQSFSLTTLAEWPYIAAPPETGRTFMENAKTKASYYAKMTGECCIADDSGLEVDALGGRPGVMSARYTGEGADDKENNRLLLENMKDEDERVCRFVCALALAAATGEVIFCAEGETEGVLLREGRGVGGFGYDPLFYSPFLGKTLAEASAEEKNAISHRGRALAAVREFLKSCRFAPGAAEVSKRIAEN